MATTLSLQSLLDSDKLMGPNFDSWYRKMKIVLEYEQILYVLIDPALKEPAPNARNTIWDTYQKWLNHRTIVYCIMLAAVNNEFSYQFENAQPHDMLQMLNKSFGTPDDIKRHKTSCDIFNARMRKGESVTDHVLYMIEMIEHWVSSASSCMSSWKGCNSKLSV